MTEAEQYVFEQINIVFKELQITEVTLSSVVVHGDVINFQIRYRNLHLVVRRKLRAPSKMIIAFWAGSIVGEITPDLPLTV
jgi:hypothetical protein